MQQTINLKENYKLQDPFPEDPVGIRLLKYFDYQWRHLRGKTVSRLQKVQWRTEKRYFIKKRNLWIDWQKDNIQLGMGFDNECQRVMIDIDKDSFYHPSKDENAYKSILDTLEDIGLCRPVVIRSSYSGGLHIYYFFSEKLNTYQTALLIRTILVSSGFKVIDGKLEIFPNTKVYKKLGEGFSQYKMHRLPLQPESGSVILNPSNLEYIGDSLEKFAQLADESAERQDINHFKRMINLAKTEDKNFWKIRNSRRKVNEWREHLLDFIEEGWTGYHQTNVILGEVAKYFYLFERLRGKALVKRMVEKVKTLRGYYQYCRHQYEIKSRCEEWGRSTEKFYEGFYKKPSRQENYRQMFDRTSKETPNGNEQKSANAQNRIIQAYTHLEKLGTLPSKVKERMEIIIKTAKELAGIGISKNTLFKEKNLPLWHPKHKDRKEILQEELSDTTKSIVQEETRFKPKPREEKEDILKPNNVICFSNEDERILYPSPSKGLEKNSYTNSLVKGNGAASEDLWGEITQKFPLPASHNEIKREHEGEEKKKEEREEEKKEEKRREKEKKEEKLTLKQINEDLTSFFMELIVEYPVQEKFTLIKERLKLIVKAQKQANKESKYFEENKNILPVKIIPNYETQDEWEMQIRMRIFWNSGIDVLKQEVSEWVRLMDIF